MLPTYGAVTGVFLLVHAATAKHRKSRADWLSAASGRPSFHAGALDLANLADELTRVRLAAVDRQTGVQLEGRLLELGRIADRATLMSIATLLLTVDPPPWLGVAVNSDGIILREYIPSRELTQMTWLDPQLDDILRSARRVAHSSVDEAIRKALGDLAESVVLRHFIVTDRRPVHVARVSDAFGYDIELSVGGVERIEVKASSSRTQGSFHLTRNEYEKAKYYGDEWSLIQVTFDSRAVLDQSLEQGRVLGARQVRSEHIVDLVPSDTEHFSWTETALLTPRSGDWAEFDLYS